jgi:hypothetical protein
MAAFKFSIIGEDYPRSDHITEAGPSLFECSFDDVQRITSRGPLPVAPPSKVVPAPIITPFKKSRRVMLVLSNTSHWEKFLPPVYCFH